LLGYAANQIAVFKKLVVFATNHSHDDRRVQSFVEGAQTQILVRHFIGVVSEAWEPVNKRFIQKPVGREYQARLHPSGKEALSKLKTHFGGSNILNTVRNQFAFHHPYDAEVDAGFELAAASPEFDDEWNWYLANENINTFYFVSDVVVVHGMLNAIGEKDACGAEEDSPGTEPRGGPVQSVRFVMPPCDSLEVFCAGDCRRSMREGRGCTPVAGCRATLLYRAAQRGAPD
jgi:hypothetical protein